MAQDVNDAATTALRDLVNAREQDEVRLSQELAAVRDQKKQALKALESLTGEKPKRRRGRPRKNPEATPAATA